MKVADQNYDTEKGEIAIVLDHFSIYTIVDESSAGEVLPVAVLVMTAVIVLICLGILLPQVVGRKAVNVLIKPARKGGLITTF